MSSITQRFILRRTNLPEELQPGDQFGLSIEENEIYHQINVVYRSKAGDQLVLMNLNNQNFSNNGYLFEITSVHKKQLTLKLLKITNLQETPIELTLALCLPNKPAKLDFILEKSVELGVTSISLIKSDYSNFSHQLRTERLEKILVEAAEQSERALVPKISQYTSIENFLDSSPKNLLIALERSQDSISLLEKPVNKTANTVLVGPEGGFSEKEKTLFSERRLETVNLGHHILKQDTAALISVAILKLKLTS